jgi:hypothetical protein
VTSDKIEASVQGRSMSTPSSVRFSASLRPSSLACSIAFSVFALVGSVACHGGMLDVGTAAAGKVDVAGGPQPPLDGGAALPGDGMVRFDEPISSLVVDGTHVYLASERAIYAVPKAGGAPAALHRDPPLLMSTKVALAVDDTHVYVAKSDRVERIPKAGGSPETVFPDLQYPRAMVLDATHLYVAVEGNFLPGHPPGPAILRAPKAGGSAEMIASDQPYVTTMSLEGDHVYFATGYDDPQSSLRRVRKAGGPAEILVTGIDTRMRASSSIGAPRAIRGVALLPDRLTFTAAGKLAFAPREGGAFETTIEVDDFLVDGESLIVARLDPASSVATLERVDGRGAPQATLARWTLPKVENPMASVYASLAMVSDGTTVFWVDFDNHTASTTERSRSTLRSFALR